MYKKQQGVHDRYAVKSLMWNNSHGVVNFRARFSQLNLNANFIICSELNLNKLKRTGIYIRSQH